MVVERGDIVHVDRRNSHCPPEFEEAANGMKISYLWILMDAPAAQYYQNQDHVLKQNQ
jgi:hypothetical protein